MAVNIVIYHLHNMPMSFGRYSDLSYLCIINLFARSITHTHYVLACRNPTENTQTMTVIKQYLSPSMQEQWNTLIRDSKKIVVLGHAGPDGDAMGAILAMTHYLQTLGKDVTPMTPNPCPDFLHWLPGIENVVNAKNNKKKARSILNASDLIVCLDFNSPSRLEDLQEDVVAQQVPTILIDHHLDPAPGPQLCVSDPQASATCEILFCILYPIANYDIITPDMASCLYCGLMTDTGAFAYNSNRACLYHIVSLLLNKGIDKDRIYRNVYYSYTESRLRLMGYLMYEKMIYLPQEHAAIFALSSEEMARFDYVRGDAEGFVNLPLQIKGTRLSISLREDTEKPVVRVSLRSVDNFPCNKMAEEFFNGGGHMNAAGGTLPKPIEQAVETAKRAIQAYRDMLI